MEKCNPAVVGITVKVNKGKKINFGSFSNEPFFKRFFERQGISLGSGFIVSSNGYILTNHHVIENASEIIVTMTGGKKFDTEIIGADKISDIALLKINGNGLPYLELGNSDNVMTGEWAIAFGNPFGLFDRNVKPTVSLGIVSNTEVNLLIKDPDNDDIIQNVHRNLIQTDAAINHGNSGGPLVNSQGVVIGINTLLVNPEHSGYVGIGYAIPSNRVKKITDILKIDKKIERDVYVGIKYKEVDKSISEYLDIDNELGIVIYGVAIGSPADKAGIESGDIILEIDGTKIQSEEDFLIVVDDGIVGQEMNFVLKRDNKIINKTLKLESRR